MLRREWKDWKKTLKFTITSAAFGMVAGFGVMTFSQEVMEKPPVDTETYVAVTDSTISQSYQTAVADTMSSIGMTNLNGTTANVIDVSNIVEATLPSVVAVNCITYTQQSSMFGMYYNGYSGNVVEEASCGTGIIIGESEDSLLVLTNNHVIEDADKVSVTFVDETEVEGSVLGSDADADIAVIVIPMSSISETTRGAIKTAVLGDSDEVRVGEAAIAIGNALGYGQSVTTGVISALNREVNLTDKTMTLLQTDAAINGGNSGGPLLNAKGEVIGINTVKYAASGVEGMGYAIPISGAKPIIESVINGSTSQEQKSAGVLFGIYGIDVTEQYQRMYQMPAGVYVYQVVEDSPAEIYNVPAGSVITAIDGKVIRSMEELSEMLANHVPGDVITVTYVTFTREGQLQNSVQVTLAEKTE